MPKSTGTAKSITENPKLQGNAKKGKGALFTLLTFLGVIVVIAAVFGGVFYFVIHNNINGLAEHYRSSIQNIPLAKLALPKAPDPKDPKYMTAEYIKKKYVEYRDENEVLQKQLSEANIKLDEYQGLKDEYENLKADTEKKLLEIKDREAAIDEKELQLRELKQKIDELTVNGDKESFKTYFETLDQENAKLLYAEVVREQQVNENIKKFSQVYAAMDAATAAQIFEQLGNSNIDMTAETLKAMSKENASAIIESMTPVFAAKLTEKLNALFRGN